MCQRTTCATCGKPGWTGCGAHVEDILGDVAPEDRCACAANDVSSAPGLFQRLLGKD